VYTEPRDLARSELRAVLERNWGLQDVELEYLPVGFGSHHWLAVGPDGARRFVTADDLEAEFQPGPDADAAFAALERAFRTAAALRADARLDFVVAPLADGEGKVIRRLGARYTVTVSPFVEGESGAHGSYESLDEHRAMGRILGRLHAATARIPAGLPRTEDFELPSRAALQKALQELDRPWTSGPFGEPARRLLRGGVSEIERRLGEYDALTTEARATSASWVLTHGEPHSANVIREDGRLRLVDWDTTLIAPRERDLRMVLDDDGTGWDEYVGAFGSASLNERILRLYELWWVLAEICMYTRQFRRPHERTEDTLVAWNALQSYVPVR
jgi:spectinomycin phosphotransferase